MPYALCPMPYEHLMLLRKAIEFIEAFVRAKLRERKPHELYGWSNQSLCSRLPKWIQSGKNREEILKAIAKIRESVVTPT
jgi:hypothetical protein